MIGIIGGGAAGMVAAIAAARAGGKVVLMERADRVGKKLAATGNGRCNLSNENVCPQRYFSHSPAQLEQILGQRSLQDVLAFFEGLGLLTFADSEGRIYPKSNLATSVLDVLRFALDEYGVKTETGRCVTDVTYKKGYAVRFDDGSTRSFDKLIIACGGPAAPKLGGTNAGLTLLKSLGHRITPVFPVLTPLDTAAEMAVIKPLKGIRVRGRISAYVEKQLLMCEQGELLFTDTGVSGIAAMQLSSPIARSKGNISLSLDLFPDHSLKELTELLENRKYLLPQRTAEKWLIGLVHRRVGEALLKRARIPFDTLSDALTAQQLAALAGAAKSFTLRCSGTRGYDAAQAASGGASLEEFFPHSLESTLFPGLFACGEVLDAVGECGGYNLHWAWVTGLIAGTNAAL